MKEVIEDNVRQCNQHSNELDKAIEYLFENGPPIVEENAKASIDGYAFIHNVEEEMMKMKIHLTMFLKIQGSSIPSTSCK